MPYLPLPVPAELNDDVRSIGLMEEHPGVHPYRRVFPTGDCEWACNLLTNELSCHRRDSLQPNRLRGAIMAGAQRSYIVVDARQLRRTLVVTFKPGGVWRRLGVALGELTDRHCELADVAGAQAADMPSRASQSRTPAELVRAVSASLGRRRGRELHPAIRWAADQICDHPEAVRIHDLVTESGLSRRSFNRLFAQQVGMAPKGFARIRRFNSVLQRMRRNRPPAWSQLAAEGGYADQAHLIREFREYTGLTPASYLSLGAPDHPQHESAASGQLTPPQSSR